MTIRISIERILLVLTLVAMLFFLFWHGKVGMVRYFDADEFAYMHWGHDASVGKIPYVDFFFYATPGFLWFLVPLYWVIGGVDILISARFVAFLVFIGLSLSTGYLAYLRQPRWTAITAPLLLAFLPLPFDKFLEVRPDNLATLLALIGVIVTIVAMRRPAVRSFFWAGFIMSISVLVIQKTVLFGVFTALILLGWTIKRRQSWNYFSRYCIGLLAPLSLFLLWAIALGKLEYVLYSIVLLPTEVARISQYFIMMPDLFFYPNGIFYGRDGYSLGLLVNHAVWLVAIVTASLRLVTPMLARGKEEVWTELYLTGLFFINVVLYVYIYPFKHTQYLIPIAAFVAIFAAEAIDMVWNRLRTRNEGKGLFFLLYVVVLVILGRSFFVANVPKLAWTNDGDQETLSHILATVPAGAYVFDLTGGSIYYPSPYFVCCFPFGQSQPFLSKALPSVSRVLEESGTNYILQGKLERVTTLSPEDQVYIGQHFVPWQYDTQLLIRRGL